MLLDNTHDLNIAMATLTSRRQCQLVGSRLQIQRHLDKITEWPRRNVATTINRIATLQFSPITAFMHPAVLAQVMENYIPRLYLEVAHQPIISVGIARETAPADGGEGASSSHPPILSRNSHSRTSHPTPHPGSVQSKDHPRLSRYLPYPDKAHSIPSRLMAALLSPCQTPFFRGPSVDCFVMIR